MRLKKYLKELSMKKGTKIDYFKNTNDALYATITLEGGEEFKIYAASDWYSRFHLAQKLKIGEDRIKEKVMDQKNPFHKGKATGKNVYGIYIWNIDFVDEKGEIALSPKAKGVSIQLFAAIETFMKDLSKKQDPQGLEFSAYFREQSRIRLYQHLAKRIEKKGYQYFARGDYHILVKKEYLR